MDHTFGTNGRTGAIKAEILHGFLGVFFTIFIFILLLVGLLVIYRLMHISG